MTGLRSRLAALPRTARLRLRLPRSWRLRLPRWLPRRTVRLRLTLTYGALFLASGAALLTITYLLVVHATTGFVFTRDDGSSLSTMGGQLSGPGKPSQPGAIVCGPDDPLGTICAPDQKRAARDAAQVAQAHADVLHQLLVQSGFALAAMALVSIALGWLVAGRVLGKVSTITSAVRNISATNLHDRLALTGPDDELKELGDTFDGLLERLEAAFEAQRRFVANASHELRTPLARQRVLAQVALADPAADATSLRTAHERVLASGREQEQLIDALLTLARGQNGVDRPVELDLAEVAASVIRARDLDDAPRPDRPRPDGPTLDGPRPGGARPGEARPGDGRSIEVDARLRPARIVGDRRLVARLIGNLLDNAMRYNTAPGWVAVATGVRDGAAVLTVTNSGPYVPAEQTARLLEPFQRVGAERVGAEGAGSSGHGLGLSIVRAIATAHGADLGVRSRAAGGLDVEVRWPVEPEGSIQAYDRDEGQGLRAMAQRIHEPDSSTDSGSLAPQAPTGARPEAAPSYGGSSS